MPHNLAIKGVEPDLFHKILNSPVERLARRLSTAQDAIALQQRPLAKRQVLVHSVSLIAPLSPYTAMALQ
jgi:hypothetical protein